MKLEFFEYAQKLSKVCIDLEPTSFEPYFIHIQALFAQQKYSAGLITMDSAPMFNDPVFITQPVSIQSYNISLPYSHKSTDIHQYMILPRLKLFDFRSSENLEGVNIFDLNVYGLMPA